MSVDADGGGDASLAALDSLTDPEIYRSVVATLRDVVLPALPPEAEWARVATVQLAGLARYGQLRGADQTLARVDELATLLGELSANDLVAAHWNGRTDQASVMSAIGAVLAAAVTDASPAAVEARQILRPVVMRQLDDELTNTAPLVDAFRGRLDE